LVHLYYFIPEDGVLTPKHVGVI